MNLHSPKMYPLPINPNIPKHLVEQENCIDSENYKKYYFHFLSILEISFVLLTLISSFKLFPLKSK